MLKWISLAWCKTMHSREAMWPIHGRYRCAKCMQEYAVKWEPPNVTTGQPQPSRGLSIPSSEALTQ